MAWEFAKMLNSPNGVPAIKAYTVGTGGVVKGMPVTLTGGSDTVITATGGANACSILGVAMGTVAAGGTVEVLLATADTVFFIQADAEDTIVLGTTYNLLATTLVLDATLTSNKKVKVIGTDPLRSGWYECINISFLS